MAGDIPQWLTVTYVRSMQSAGSQLSKEELTHACSVLLERWSSSDRYYHGIHHVIDTLTHIETLEPAIHSPELVRLAAWYHGAVFSVAPHDIYTRNGGEDEIASAALAEKELVALGVSEANAQRVAELIRSLRTRTSDASAKNTAKFQAIDVDVLALRDAHFACLAVEPQRYRSYIDNIRREYADVSDIGFYVARRAIVHNLLHRRPLFITPLARPWEDIARGNLEAEQERIIKRLKDLEASTPLPAHLPHTPHPPVLVPHSVPATENTPRPPMSATPQSGPETLQFDAVTADLPPTAPSVPSAQDGERQLSDVSISIGNLLRHSAQVNEEEAATQERLRERFAGTPQEPITRSMPIKDTQSSMEAISDRVEGGERTRTTNETPEERKKRRREEITEQLRKRVSERQRATEETRPHSDPLRPQGVSATSPVSVATPPSAPSAPTPAMQEDTADVPQVSGMEREPKE